VNIKGVKRKVEFEVFEIMDESDPYAAFLGIDWVFDNNAVLNSKKHQMSFENDTLCVVVPLDPYEINHYNDPVDDDSQSSIIENIYKVKGNREDYINPTADRELSWRSVRSYDADYEDALDRWKNNIYKVLTMRCTHISTKEIMKGFVSYRYDGLEPMCLFIKLLRHIPEY